MNYLVNRVDYPADFDCVGQTTPPGSEDYPLGQHATERLLKIAADYCDTKGGCHGPDHTERVHATALYIGRCMNARLEVLSAAALLHDIGRRDETTNKGRICHAARGAEMASAILTEFDLDRQTIEQILHCIATHRFRGNAVPQSLEAKILFDADKLDSIGAIGIGRAFLFAGEIGARLHNTHDDVENTLSYSIDDTAYREFRVKMSKIKNRMLTPEGKRLAQERHAFMEIFFNRLDREIRGTVDSATID